MQSHNVRVPNLFEYLSLGLSVLLLIHLHDQVLAEDLHGKYFARVPFLHFINLSEGATPDHHHLVEVLRLLRRHLLLVGRVAH